MVLYATTPGLGENVVEVVLLEVIARTVTRIPERSVAMAGVNVEVIESAAPPATLRPVSPLSTLNPVMQRKSNPPISRIFVHLTLVGYLLLALVTLATSPDCALNAIVARPLRRAKSSDAAYPNTSAVCELVPHTGTVPVRLPDCR